MLRNNQNAFIKGAETSIKFDTFASRQIADLVRESYQRQQDVMRSYPFHLRKTIIETNDKSDVYTLAPPRFLFFR